MEEANDNALESDDILFYSENVKNNKISEQEQVKVLDDAEEEAKKKT